MQVKNFRCIEDSTEFATTPVTCFVGKNGAGKTSLLEALYKLNPDVAELGSFDVLMEYPRSRRRDYQKRAHEKPDDALITTWELEEEDVAALENELGPRVVKSPTVAIRKGYYPGRLWSAAVSDRAPALVSAGGNHGTERPGLAQRPSELRERESADRGPRLQDAADDFFEEHLGKLLPTLLYFSEWHIMRGRISIDALQQRKERGELTGPDRVFLALLQLGGTSLEALTRIERSEELIADLEDAARPITQEIAKYWSQEGDLRVSFHLYVGRPQDPTPFDHGLVFETRILNAKTDLSLNFEERSTGFVWFFSFLVWYSDVRRRYGDDLVILLDDPGLGLHARAQWDLLRYVYEELAPHHQVLYATHSPFMIDPDRIHWVRTVEEVSQQTKEGRFSYLGTKVSEEAISEDYGTLLPLQASLGYRIVQDLTGDRRHLLVEKPADVIYLHWFSARLNARGRTGLRPDWTVTPCGDLTRLATLAGLLAQGPSRFAVLFSLSPGHPDVVARQGLAEILGRSNALALHAYAEPLESTLEDLIGPATYIALVDQAYKLPRKQRLARTAETDPGAPLLKAVSDHFATNRPTTAGFDPMVPAEYLLTAGRKLRKLPGWDTAASRFERLFRDLNGRL